MKKFRTYIIALLLFPLLISFSEASFLQAVNCAHCQLVKKSTPSCCHVPSQDAHHTVNRAPAKTQDCPHGGYCKGDDKAPVQIIVTSHTDNSGIHYIVDNAEYKSELSEKLVRFSRPPPDRRYIPIYIINCSFLI